MGHQKFFDATIRVIRVIANCRIRGSRAVMIRPEAIRQVEGLGSKLQLLGFKDCGLCRRDFQSPKECAP
jgi:hypothetical protein